MATSGLQEIRSWSMLERLTKAKSAKPGKIYGAPGDGYSGHISLITALVLSPEYPSETVAGPIL